MAGFLTRRIAFCLAVLVATCLGCASPPALDLQDLPTAQRALVDEIGSRLAVVARSKGDGVDVLQLEMHDLYAPLGPEQRDFLDALRALPGGDASLGVPDGIDWVQIEGQVARTPAGEVRLPLQLLPAAVARRFGDMNAAMRSDIGRGLLVGSGYRSPANQLLLLVTYLPFYDYSIEATTLHVSLPGASDHNRVDRQGIDFVSESGIDLQYGDATAFIALPEHAWLVEHAAKFGFAQPDAAGGQPVTSPWHWRYEAAE